MKTQLTLTALALTLLTSSAFALPSNAPFPLLGEHQDSQTQLQQPLTPLAENGSERTPGQQRLKLAEDGYDRTPGAQQVQLAEDGYDRTPGAQHVQLAEDGYDRTPGAQHVQLAEGGSDRLIEQRAHHA